MKAETATNYLGVAWECSSNGLAQQVIPGQCLAPYRMNYVPHPASFTARLHQDAFSGATAAMMSVQDVNTSDTATFKLLSSNEEGLFSLDPATGVIRLLEASGLLADGQTNFTFVVEATDDGVPPLSGTGTVTITIVPTNIITATTLQQEIWTNIPGSDVLALTSEARFPKRPDL